MCMCTIRSINSDCNSLCVSIYLFLLQAKCPLLHPLRGEGIPEDGSIVCSCCEEKKSGKLRLCDSDADERTDVSTDLKTSLSLFGFRCSQSRALAGGHEVGQVVIISWHLVHLMPHPTFLPHSMRSLRDNWWVDVKFRALFGYDISGKHKLQGVT